MDSVLFGGRERYRVNIEMSKRKKGVKIEVVRRMRWRRVES